MICFQDLGRPEKPSGAVENSRTLNSFNAFQSVRAKNARIPIEESLWVPRTFGG